MAKPPPLTKITARLFAPMYKDFDRQMSEALLRRDAFLDRMISGEIAHLRSDMAGRRLSAEANRYIAGQLKSMGGRKAPPLKQVSISVTPKTASALRKVVEEHNLVRDAFINWLIALLRSSDMLLDAVELPKRTCAVRGGANPPAATQIPPPMASANSPT